MNGEDAAQEQEAEVRENERRVLFPGVSFAYLSDKDAFNTYSDDNASRQVLHNVCFKVRMDTTEG